jgi:hypothetical protein
LLPKQITIGELVSFIFDPEETPGHSVVDVLVCDIHWQYDKINTQQTSSDGT